MPKITEKYALVLCLLVPLGLMGGACGSDHRVSPWGGLDRPRLDPFLQTPDLASSLALVDEETARLGLQLRDELEGKLPRGAGPVRLRGYEGRDTLGRTVFAVRAVSANGIILAAGPLAVSEVDRHKATELVPVLHLDIDEGEQALAYRSATDITGDGAPDAILRSESGRLEIWRMLPFGATKVLVELTAPPTRALDVDRDGRLDLGGELSFEATEDPIAPRFKDVATFEGGRYSNQSASARAYHARLADRPVPASPSPELRLRHALEQAFHGVLAGRKVKPIEETLAKESVPEALRPAFERHMRRIHAISSQLGERGSERPGEK